MPDSESLDSLAELVQRCTVRISHRGSQGTGFFVAPGLILTCAHVLGETSASRQTVRLRWNKSDFQGTLEKLLPDPCPRDDIFPDLAVISHNIPDSGCVQLGPAFKEGDRFYSWGYSELRPGGESLSGICEGEAAYDETGERRLIKFKDTQVLPGISGSPLLNRRTGKVCGILKRTRGIDSNVGGLAVRVEWVFQHLPEIAARNELFHETNGQWLNAFHCTPRRYGSETSKRLRYGPKFVDRETQENEFRDFWIRATASRLGVPVIYILPALDVDCPEYFVDRLEQDVVQRFAQSFNFADKAAVERVIIREPSSYSSLEVLQKEFGQEVFVEFGAIEHLDPLTPSAKSLSKLQRLRLRTFLIVEQTIHVDAAYRFLRELLVWHSDSFWADFRCDSKLLIFLHLKCSAPKRRSFFRKAWTKDTAISSYQALCQQLERIFPDGHANLSPESKGAPIKSLPPLAPIQLNDIKRWLQPFTLPHMVDSEARRLCREFRTDGQTGIHLSYLYEVLDDYYHKQVTERYRG